jgi:hypothetical protein
MVFFKGDFEGLSWAVHEYMALGSIWNFEKGPLKNPRRQCNINLKFQHTKYQHFSPIENLIVKEIKSTI